MVDSDFCVLFADGVEDFSLENEYLALVDSGAGPKWSNALGVLHLDETEVCTQVGYKRLYIHMDLTCCQPIINNPEEQGTAFYVYIRVPRNNFMESLSQYDAVIKSNSFEPCAPEKWEGYVPGE